MASEPTVPSEPAAPVRLSRRHALRLLAGAFLSGAAACSSPVREARRAAATTTTTAPPPTTTTEAAPTTTTEAAPTTTTEAAPPSTQPPAVDPAAPIAGFVAFGDFGGGAAQVEVAQAMERWAAAHRVDALVTTGDNVYDYGEPHLFVAQLDEPYRVLREAGRPMWVTLGNHDVMWGHGPAQLAHLGLPPLPYVQELPGVRFLFLDGNRPDAGQTAWLDDQLGQTGPPFSVVVFHAPVYSCGLHGPLPPLAANWAPVIERHRVPLVLNGHDHLYQRFLSPGGVTYVVTGGGGQELYAHTPGCAPPELAASAMRHHFTAVEVYAERLVVSAVGVDDAVFDRTEIPVLAAVPAGAGSA